MCTHGNVKDQRVHGTWQDNKIQSSRNAKIRRMKNAGERTETE